MKLAAVTLISFTAVLTACAPPPAEPPPPPTVVDALAAGNYTLVDLTHPFFEGMPTISLPEPLAQTPPFHLENISKYDEGGPAWYWNWYQVGEHTGTHVDAPNHWVSGKDYEAIDAIPIERLVCPAVVVDVRDKAAAEEGYRVTVEDLQGWEAAHGEIPKGAMVLMASGWSEKFSDPEAFIAGGNAPGFSPEAARWLLDNRDIAGIGTDTVSTENLASASQTDPPFEVHIFLHEAGKYQIEMIAQPEALPPVGAWLVIAPMKVRGGSGAPSRIFGLLPG